MNTKHLLLVCMLANACGHRAVATNAKPPFTSSPAPTTSQPASSTPTPLAAPLSPTISASPATTPLATGIVASIAPQLGVTYAWTLSAGTAISDADGSVFVWQAPANGAVVLTCVVANSAGQASATVTVNVVVQSGALQIEFAGASPTPAVVNVSGPGNFSQQLAAAGTLAALAPGSYAVSAPTISQDGYNYAALISNPAPQIDIDQTTQLTITYARTPIAPSLAPIANVSALIGNALAAIPIVVSNLSPSDPMPGLTVTSDNEALFTPAALTLTPTADGASLTLVSPAVSGTATFFVTATSQSGAQAFASFTVNIGDVMVTNTDDSGPGSLRDAIANAAFGTVVFSPLLSGQSIVLLTPIVSELPLSLLGPGAQALTISGADTSALLAIGGGANTDAIVVSGLTFAHGAGSVVNQTVELGAADGSVYVADCVFADNQSSDNGGALFIEETPSVSITRSTFSGNTAMNGGAIFFDHSVGEITDSAIIGNTAGSKGGAIQTSSATLTFLNDTVSGNRAGATTLGASGGALDGQSTSIYTVIQSTFTGNQVPAELGNGGGAIHGSGTLVLFGSIVAGNSASTGPDVNASVVSQGYNFIGVGDGNTWDPTDQVGTAAVPLAAPLSALGDYGGATQTQAPLAGSVLVDQIPANGIVVTTDQRGRPRPSGGAGDIGAFERQPTD